MSFHKHLQRTAIATVFLSFLSCVSVFAAVSARIEGTNVNVRQEASTEAEKVGQLNTGDTVTVLDKTDGWYHVSYDGMESAYIASDYIIISSIPASVKGSEVHIRSIADTSGDIVATVNDGDTLTVTGRAVEWYKVSIDGKEGYIYKNYIEGDSLAFAPEVPAPVKKEEPPVAEVSASGTETVTAAAENTYAIVTAMSGLRLREGPSTETNSILIMQSGEIVDVLEPGGEWTKVKTVDGQTGYVSTEFISVRSGEKPSRSDSSKGEQVVAYAKQFLGTPYVWGGTSLGGGVDCSGFVYSVMKHFGVNLNRSSSSMASNGVFVSKDQLIPGDLVLFDTNGSNNGSISHVGIYIGDGQYIHSSSGRTKGVIITNLYEDYSVRTYVTARRVLR